MIEAERIAAFRERVNKTRPSAQVQVTELSVSLSADDAQRIIWEELAAWFDDMADDSGATVEKAP